MKKSIFVFFLIIAAGVCVSFAQTKKRPVRKTPVKKTAVKTV